MEATIIIPGNPIAKKRPRFARRGKFVVTYNDQETEEGRWIWELRQQWSLSPLEGSIQLEVNFYMPIPKNLLKKWDKTEHIKRPDLDNLIKFVKDCCNQTLWKDDSQVWNIKAFKMYSPNPQTFIRIYW